MRRCVLVAVFAISLFTGRTAFADSIVLHEGDTLRLLDPGGPPIWGGVFTVDVDGIGTPGIVDFVTFCVQQESPINGVDTFKVSHVGDPSIPSENAADDQPNPDPLDDKTAWIYSQFLDGALSSYSEDEIQSAIWLIEEESYFTNNLFLSKLLTQQNRDNANALITAAGNAVSAGYRNTDVSVLTLVFGTDRDDYDIGDPAQDILIRLGGGTTTQDVHMPEPATLVLVGSGVVGLIRRHSKRRRTS